MFKLFTSKLSSFMGLLAFLGLMLPVGAAQAGTAQENDASVDAALAEFKQRVKGADEYLAAAKGVLVMPGVKKVGFVVGVCIDLTLRYFFDSPLLWGTEVTEILLLYITFLGMAWVFKEDGHVVIDVFTGKATGMKKKILNGISYLLVGTVSAVLIYYGFYAALDHFKRGVFNPTVIETPIALIIIVIPIGSIPLFLDVLIKFRKLVKKS